MELNKVNKLNSAAISSYKSIKPNKSAVPSEIVQTDKKGNFDTVEFNFEQSLGSAKASIAAKLSADTEAVKLQMLKAAYAGDSCPVSPEEIADAILMS